MGLIRAVLRKLRIFLEMIKFEHSIFALPFAYLGLFLAEGGLPGARVFFLVTVAMVSFRTMAMAVNRLMDREIDARNPRTQNRALPAHKLKTGFVWVLTLLSLAIFEWSAWVLNPLCFKLSPVAVALAWAYPYLKRFTWFSHLVLGMILGIAPYGAWIAARGTFSWVPAWLMLGVASWVCGFDMIYALQDESFDRSSGLHSFPARFGARASITGARALHALTIIFWLMAGFEAGLGIYYFSGLALAAGFLIREHWLVHLFGLQKVGEAFFTMNAVVSAVVFFAAVLDLVVGKGF
ncbi:putative 4-hydroxybenzoate polyprenyltransferase [Omnitrophica bacterium]|nr:putative 4-hydroxybenzoate polyprenyltransferase [Candidatus Omnitrophota bacterium]